MNSTQLTVVGIAGASFLTFLAVRTYSSHVIDNDNQNQKEEENKKNDPALVSTENDFESSVSNAPQGGSRRKRTNRKSKRKKNKN
jgi:hypothetical protein